MIHRESITDAGTHADAGVDGAGSCALTTDGRSPPAETFSQVGGSPPQRQYRFSEEPGVFTLPGGTYPRRFIEFSTEDGQLIDRFAYEYTMPPLMSLGRPELARVGADQANVWDDMARREPPLAGLWRLVAARDGTAPFDAFELGRDLRCRATSAAGVLDGVADELDGFMTMRVGGVRRSFATQLAGGNRLSVIELDGVNDPLAPREWDDYALDTTGR